MKSACAEGGLKVPAEANAGFLSSNHLTQSLSERTKLHNQNFARGGGIFSPTPCPLSYSATKKQEYGRAVRATTMPGNPTIKYPRPTTRKKFPSTVSKNIWPPNKPLPKRREHVEERARHSAERDTAISYTKTEPRGYVVGKFLALRSKGVR
jgi:hypothetical protein